MTQVPAATRALAVLTYLASVAGPQPAGAIARALGLPRSSTYHLLDAMRESGFVVHIPADERWGLGVSAFEVGAAYTRHDPLERLAAPLLQAMVRAVAPISAVAYLAVLHGSETLYLAKAESRHLPIVTEVGVRLPAALTASGRAMLAAMPLEQVHAIFSTPTAWVDRTGRGPTNWMTLRSVLQQERQRGWSEEDGHVSDGFASVAAAVRGHLHDPVAAIGVTFGCDELGSEARASLAQRVVKSANGLSRRIGEREQ